MGLLATGIGSLIFCGLGFSKLVLGNALMLQHGPLLFAATLLVLVGVQILCLGLVAEMVSRTYYESQGKPIYSVRRIIAREPQAVIPVRKRLRRVEGAIAPDKSIAV
jgi:dolichol-phosphate mannosyltransferase